MKNVFAAIRAPLFHGLYADPFQNSAASTLRRLVLIGLASTKKIVPLVNRAAAGEQENLSACPLRKTFYARR